MKRGIVLFFLVLFLSGCAFGTRRPILEYTTILPTAPKNNVAIKVHLFVDERSWSKEKVGDVKNGYGMRCADIIPQNSVTEWVTDALKQELVNAGYNVSDDVSSINEINGDVLEVYTDAYWNYGGRVKLKIKLLKEQKEVLVKEYSAQKNCGMQWAATAASFGKTLKVTLQDAMKKIIPDINKILLEKTVMAK